VQRSFFSKRNLAVAAETAEFEAFAVRTDFEADLDTDADQHLRRRSGAKQEQMFDECVEAGLSPVTTL
jgi:predicted ATP-grasp superfamily ATP-dependent carboligase